MLMSARSRSPSSRTTSPSSPATSAPTPNDEAAMLAVLGFASRGALIDASCRPRSAARRRCACRPRSRGRGARRAARHRGAEPGAEVLHRPGLLRHPHARRDPAQRAREPGLVHGVHAVPAGDLAGPARGAAQLPDDGTRPHRHGDRQRVDARRGHRRGRGDDAGAALGARARPRPSSSPTTCCRRRSTWCARAPSRSASRSSPRPGERRGCSGDASRCWCSIPAPSGEHARPTPLTSTRCTPAARARVAAADLLALTLLTPPGEWGADVAVGTTQRFGVPMGFGGPHAGYMACATSSSAACPGAWSA